MLLLLQNTIKIPHSVSKIDKTFAVFGNKFQADKSLNIAQVLQSIATIGGKIVIERDFADFLQRHIELGSVHFERAIPRDIEADFAISIGGDGTFLKTAQLVGERNMPIIGINTGRLGFISDILPQDTDSLFRDLAEGNYKIEERALLMAETGNAEDNYYGCALNEIAILKHDNSSMISISTYVDGNYLATYLADGLIVSTPTGSTGYSLSVGGPIISPDSKSIVLSPIAAHSLAVRPIVLNDDVSIELRVQSRSHNYMLSVDGRSESLYEDTPVIIQTAPHRIRIVRRADHSFFDTLRNKLLWGADKR